MLKIPIMPFSNVAYYAIDPHLLFHVMLPNKNQNYDQLLQQ